VLGNSDNDGHVRDFNGGDFNAGDSNVNRDIADWSITESKVMQEFQEMVSEAKRENLGALDNALGVFQRGLESARKGATIKDIDACQNEIGGSAHL
jgi:hypothetical protein